jgi:excisionase family DNA binding protein
MAAYATHEREPSAHQSQFILEATNGLGGVQSDGGEPSRRRLGEHGVLQHARELSLVEQLLDRLADRIAVMLAERLGAPDAQEVEWFDSRRAAEYLGIHRDTLRKLAAERTIPSEQDGARCKLYFRRADLDAWRRSGGRPRHLASVVASA